MEAILFISWVALIVIAYQGAVMVLDKSGAL